MQNIHFRTYKDEATLASDHARKIEMETLNHLCVDQVGQQLHCLSSRDISCSLVPNFYSVRLKGTWIFGTRMMSSEKITSGVIQGVQ